MSYPEPEEDRVVALLEALLSEQRAMSARQADAIENQRRAIDLQQKAIKRSSRVLTVVFVAMALVVVASYVAPYVGLWLVHR